MSLDSFGFFEGGRTSLLLAYGGGGAQIQVFWPTIQKEWASLDELQKAALRAQWAEVMKEQEVAQGTGGSEPLPAKYRAGCLPVQYCSASSRALMARMSASGSPAFRIPRR